MATQTSRYQMSMNIELLEQGKEAEGPMWKLSNSYYGLDYEGVINLQKLIGGVADQITNIGVSAAESLKGGTGSGKK